jgi:hypothetical protein
MEDHQRPLAQRFIPTDYFSLAVEEKKAGQVKAELIALGRIRVPRELIANYRLSRSTAGPGAGATSLALGWMGDDEREHRVKLGLAPEDEVAPLELVKGPDGTLEIRRRDGTLLVSGARLLPIVMHAPDHAFINLDGDCVYECAFCTAHALAPARRNSRTPERWVELIVKAHERDPFSGLAITSVASPDHEGLLQDYEAIIRGVLAHLPDVTVGVEPPVESEADIERLKEAGAEEIKINIQTPDPEILARVCPGWDLERQEGFLERAVKVFGRGKVTTNIIIGLGEDDQDVIEALERLAAMGVVASVRAVRVGDLNREGLEGALGHPVDPVEPERHLRLGRALAHSLLDQGLMADAFETMCHKCGCCDLEPGVDT